MHETLHNPVWTALTTRDAHLGTRAEAVAWFDADVSPFAGFAEDNSEGLAQLHRLLPEGRRILFARPERITALPGWRLAVHVPGLQFVYGGPPAADAEDPRLLPLTAKHAEEMVALAALTRPGPFDLRTIEFGHYYGVFADGRLVAMTGQRLHLPGYSEISAVCTHPDHLGKGYAAALIQKQLALICAAGDTPFLHVRADNDRAIAIYERLGFTVSRPMQFYFLQRER